MNDWDKKPYEERRAICEGIVADLQSYSPFFIEMMAGVLSPQAKRNMELILDKRHKINSFKKQDNGNLSPLDDY